MSENENKVVMHSMVEVSVNPNHTTAFVSFTRPENGGVDITVEKIMAALDEKNVSYGILKDDIELAVEQKRYDDNVCVAKWDPPQDGVDGTIKYFYNIESHLAPVENEQGVVDYKNLGLVRNITAGTPIAAITLPTEGEPGKDIMGRTVMQKKGVPAKVNVGAGTSLINDGKEIIAAVDGNLVYKNGAFYVDETLVVNGDVDVSSGNIDFIGAVTIKGSVFEGFRVTSKRDININGSVNGAELSADGNINIKIGSINSQIDCKGDVKLGFCENTKIRAEGNVESASFVGGEVFADKKIIASGKGVIMGGKYTALDGIEASVIGSDKYAKTLLTLGNNAVLSEERDKLEKLNAELEDKADQLGKMLVTLGELAKKAKLSPEREQLKTEALRNRLKMQSEVKKNKSRINEIDETLQLTQNLSVACKRIMYPGVTLRINSCVLQVNAATNHARATVEGGEIVFKPL
ncbi:MAG: FapA family protein [Lachnospiraceae bacterium]|nr:FapA family protein [Ruminococcus sp.]MCM1275410.1 FapA family protein [Lachnospiraceae bacterium]